MNFIELIELYFLGEATESQILQIIKWLEEDENNVRDFIREINYHRDMKNFLAQKRLLFDSKIEGKKSFTSIGEQCQCESLCELPMDELMRAAGGKKKSLPDSLYLE